MRLSKIRKKLNYNHQEWNEPFYETPGFYNGYISDFNVDCSRCLINSIMSEAPSYGQDMEDEWSCEDGL